MQCSAGMRLQRMVASAAISDLRPPPSQRLEGPWGETGTGSTATASTTSGRCALSGTDRGAMEIEVTDNQ